MAAKTSWHRYGTKLRHCQPCVMVCIKGCGYSYGQRGASLGLGSGTEWQVSATVISVGEADVPLGAGDGGK